MSSDIIVGANVAAVTQKLVVTVNSISPNKVVKLDSKLLADILPLLLPKLKGTDVLFGLRLTLKIKESMTHSGWLYSNYLNACRELDVDAIVTVALYSDGLFREFGQFGILDPEALFLGFGQNSSKILNAILKAELQFNPNDFDIDGYVK